MVVDVLFLALLDDSSVCFWSCACQFNDVIGQAVCEKLFFCSNLCEAVYHLGVVCDSV